MFRDASSSLAGATAAAAADNKWALREEDEDEHHARKRDNDGHSVIGGDMGLEARRVQRAPRRSMSYSVQSHRKAVDLSAIEHQRVSRAKPAISSGVQLQTVQKTLLDVPAQSPPRLAKAQSDAIVSSHLTAGVAEQSKIAASLGILKSLPKKNKSPSPKSQLSVSRPSKMPDLYHPVTASSTKDNETYSVDWNSELSKVAKNLVDILDFLDVEAAAYEARYLKI
ncbi:hypothetical protein FB639_004899 [Coemansia asiatica]|nr:hypothetical protein FB639_004899 [Coemansia asiatica]